MGYGMILKEFSDGNGINIEYLGLAGGVAGGVAGGEWMKKFSWHCCIRLFLMYIMIVGRKIEF